MTWTDLLKREGRGLGYGKRKNGDKNAFNLKTIVGSACDTDVAAAPNLLLPLSHFYPPLKCRALSVPSVLAKPETDWQGNATSITDDRLIAVTLGLSSCYNIYSFLLH